MTMVPPRETVAAEENPQPPPSTSAAKEGRLHRIASVRQQQGVSLRAVARQMGTEIRRLRQEEDETADLRLTDIYRWQEALDVPLSELLVEPGTSLSHPVMERAQLLRLMKTATSILENSRAPGIRRMAQVMVEQLVDMMPELESVGGWHTVGQRRRLDEYGRIVERCIPDDTLFHQCSD
jgi:transcriptional regulator with XRE-family HTH domain